MNTFNPSFENLPVSLPIFPLTGVLLLPRGRLPLNIFEPRYLSMISDAMGETRMIGMLQPTDPLATSPNPELYRTGCAGRIIRFEETEDGRYLIDLLGCSRFKILDELPLKRGYRSVITDWAQYRHDLDPTDSDEIDRARLLKSLHGYFELNGIRVDWENVKDADNERLINMVAMVCPFKPSEKQALLEAEDLSERARTLVSLVEMAILSTASDNSIQQ